MIVMDSELYGKLNGTIDVQFERLYSDTNKGIVDLAKGIIGTDDAEDVSQEAYLKAWIALNKGTSLSRGWMFTTTYNEAIDRIRKGRSGVLYQPDFEVNHLKYDPERVAILNETCSVVRQATTALPPDQRTITEMHFFEDLTLGQIAQALAMPVGTVKTRFYRNTIPALRNTLAPYIAS